MEYGEKGFRQGDSVCFRGCSHVRVTTVRQHICLICVRSIKAVLELHFNILRYYTKQLKDRRQINIGLLCNFNILNGLMGKQIK